LRPAAARSIEAGGDALGYGREQASVGLRESGRAQTSTGQRGRVQEAGDAATSDVHWCVRGDGRRDSSGVQQYATTRSNLYASDEVFPSSVGS
jgi:hypothetical protein